jgi:hypothetical protein
MITMEFEEMKKIWDAQNKETVYAINEVALHNRILTKKKQSNSIANISELLLITVNLAAGGFVMVISLLEKGSHLVYMFILSLWMFGSALYSIISRVRRIRGEYQFDRTMLGDLRLAIYTATYQVRLSQIMRWNILPVGGLTVLGVWSGGKPLWIIGVMLLVFSLAYFAGGWEHGIYKSKKRELELLMEKLTTEI